ncbi:nitrile hydratase accessory protein [Aurantiacibacter hainanensis]|uniref:nitrile hydratase accessory protein n=1 Tax=Aurantiacibacter hainanensis TaxID=3076114 RepID=UPI0030C6BABE
MSKERVAKPEIAEMQGQPALPRKSGELVFHDDWERRAFAMAVSLAEQGRFAWADFQKELIAAVAEAERENPLKPTRGYFESWLVALEAVLADKRLLDD